MYWAMMNILIGSRVFQISSVCLAALATRRFHDISADESSLRKRERSPAKRCPGRSVPIVQTVITVETREREELVDIADQLKQVIDSSDV